MSLIYTLIGIFLVAGIALCYFLGLGLRPKNFPSGPPTLPLIGNLHLVPSKNEYIQFTKWAKQYGPIYSILVGSQPIIVLSDVEVVKDLLDKRSAIYSSRPEVYVTKHIPAGNLRLVTLPYGAVWRSLRKVTHSLLNFSSAKQYDPYQTLERQQMLFEMLNNPDDFFTSISRYSNSLATTLLYGCRTPQANDARSLGLVEELTAFQNVLTTGAAALLDAFPVFRYLPDWLLPVKARAHQALALGDKFHKENWYTAKKSIADGTIRPCLCVGLAKAQEKEGLTDAEAAYTVGNIFEGGSETTTQTLYAFVQAMLLFPEVQTKAQEEIERVVGPNRLPTMKDAPNMPYIRRCVKELVRWFTAAPLGAVPHAATQDDIYNGYLIPKGVPVILNVWAIQTDPERFPEPRRFNPDRFSEGSDAVSIAESATHPDPSKRDLVSFGAGRRICPGMHVADRSLFLGVSGMLWAFSIKPKKDADGKDILPDPDDLVVKIAAGPALFQADIQPRSQERAQIIREEWKKTQDLLDPSTKQWKETPEGTWTDALKI